MEDFKKAFTFLRNNNIVLQSTEDSELKDNSIQLNGKKNMGYHSCSYLGLEYHPAVKKGAMDAIMKYGTAFAVSRSYLSIGLFKELEGLLEKIFKTPVYVTSSTSMATQTLFTSHLEVGDALVLDKTAHQSIQLAAAVMSTMGVNVMKVSHADEAKTIELVSSLLPDHNTVWYAADGIYGMSSDPVSMELIQNLLNLSPKVRIFVDDAHGMSIFGSRGQGYFLSRLEKLPERVFVVTSLSKAFGSRGGVILFPNQELKTKTLLSPTPSMFSGPEPPAVLGASIASAKLHLDGTVALFQKELHQKLSLFHSLAEKAGLPVLCQDTTVPIVYLVVGDITVAAFICRELLKTYDIFSNCSGYPVVPRAQAGLRFLISRMHTNEDIVKLVKSLSKYLPSSMTDDGIEFLRNFKAKMKKPVVNQIQEIRVFAKL